MPKIYNPQPRTAQAAPIDVATGLGQAAERGVSQAVSEQQRRQEFAASEDQRAISNARADRQEDRQADLDEAAKQQLRFKQALDLRDAADRQIRTELLRTEAEMASKAFKLQQEELSALYDQQEIENSLIFNEMADKGLLDPTKMEEAKDWLSVSARRTDPTAFAVKLNRFLDPAAVAVEVAQDAYREVVRAEAMADNEQVNAQLSALVARKTELENQRAISSSMGEHDSASAADDQLTTVRAQVEALERRRLKNGIRSSLVAPPGATRTLAEADKIVERTGGGMSFVALTEELIALEWIDTFQTSQIEMLRDGVQATALYEWFRANTIRSLGYADYTQQEVELLAAQAGLEMQQGSAGVSPDATSPSPAGSGETPTSGSGGGATTVRNQYSVLRGG